MTSTLRASVQPHEVLFSCTEIRIDCSDPLNKRSAQDGIQVPAEYGEVTLSADGTQATWTPLAPLPLGSHTLKVSNLMTQSGDKLTTALEVPFFITDSKAEVSPELVVESMVRLTVQELGTTRIDADRRPKGPFIEVMKASERSTGTPQSLAFDQDGQAIDADKIFAAIDQARADKYGKLHPSLYDQLQQVGDTTPIATAIWLRAPESSVERPEIGQDPPRETPPEVLEERQKISEINDRFAAALAKRGIEAPTTDRLAPVVYAYLTGEQIRDLTADPEVTGIFLHETEIIEDLADSIAIARSAQAHNQGFRGAGIKVAVWERGPDVTTDLEIADSFDANASTNSHSRLTHAIIKNIETNAPHGHAPDCELHSANTGSTDAIAWAAEENCTVISQSFHRQSEQTSDTLSHDDIYKDFLARHWPYPTILQAAGNGFASEFVNHKGYNSLAVGSHHDDASAMAGTSVFRNPATTHGDRELPELCANGTNVTAVGVTDSGTSFAAPAVAGCTALIQEVDTNLRHCPEGCRAVLLAGAQRNVVDDTWWTDVQNNVDAADGSGALDTRESVEIAKLRRFKNAVGTQRGWHGGSLSSSDFGTNGFSNFVYRARVPTLPFPWRVKVALAWASKLSVNISGPFPIWEIERFSDLTVNLDLKVYNSNGQLVGTSHSYDNSYEIAEFLGSPGETYTIKIRRWSGTDSTRYGIAWNILPVVTRPA